MTRPAPAAAVPLVLVPALGLTQGGFSPDAWVWAGVLAAWGAALAVVVGDDAGGLVAAWAWLACAAGLLAWTIASALWSVHAAQSVLDARRTLCYAAALLALVSLMRRGNAGILVIATHLAITSLVVYALGRYLLGPHRLRDFEAYLLSEPLGYANAVGILAAMAILLGLGVAVCAPSRVGRAGAAATLPPLALAIELSNSHASWLALAVGLCAMLLLDEGFARLVRVLVAVTVPCLMLVVLGRWSGLAALATPRIDGWLLAVAAVGTALLAAVITDVLRTLWSRLRRPSARLVVPVTVAAIGIAVVALLLRGASTEPRASYYHVAWHDEYAAHPLLGSGAGTFALYWARSGHVASRGGALDVHSLYLEALAELGPIGLGLLLATLLYPLRAAVVGRRMPYAAAAASAYVAFLLHAGLDWDWEMPVVVVAGLGCAGAVVSSTLARTPPLRPPARLAVLVSALVLGAFAIAGARSHSEPAAVGRGSAQEASPQRDLGTFIRGADLGYDLP